MERNDGAELLLLTSKESFVMRGLTVEGWSLRD